MEYLFIGTLRSGSIIEKKCASQLEAEAYAFYVAGLGFIFEKKIIPFGMQQ